MGRAGVSRVSGEESSANLTQLLMDWSNGDAQALEKLIPLVYRDLHRLAERYLRSESPGHTLQSTALVHEAYLRLIDQRNTRWQNRAHFFGISAQLIRRILVDHARARNAGKRGGYAAKIHLDESVAAPDQQDVDLVVLDDRLKALSDIDPQQARVVELRYFAGLTVEETAEVMHVSPTTVKREWRLARAWLHREIAKNR
jgi:RNA polymerase sigma factor (TIGR02999 family)